MPLNTAGLASVLAQETAEVWLILVEIDHAALSQPIRVANNHADITSNGNLYVGFAFDFKLPDDADQPQQAVLTIDNVDRTIVDALRACGGDPPTCALSVIIASAPDVIQFGPITLIFGDAKYDALQVQVTLIDDPLLGEPFPGDSFVPASFPGLF